ncbi:MAG: phage tail sheath C-terminal domain-containing protein, partial [Thermodesulfovibrionales bacterium]
KGVEEFRDKIGINSLKYGAAYTPWLRSNLGINIRHRDIRGKVTRGGSVVGMEALTDSAEVKATVASLNNAVDDLTRIELDITSLVSGKGSLKAKYQSLMDTFKTTVTDTNFGALITFIYNIAEKADKLTAGASTLKGTKLMTDIRGMISGPLKTAMTTLISYDKGAETEITPGAFNLFKAHAMAAPEWGAIFVEATSPAADGSIYTGADDAAKLKAAEKSITAVFSQVNAVMAQILRSAEAYESEFGNSLYETHPVYRNLINKLSSGLTTIPPSGAMAGVYAMVDGSRGVWKAPANVSLNGVAGVTEFIDNSEQDGLNVDVVAGKSVNAIRPFTGRGIIVWGARTLAGNDNEWRYVPVRRFFNMVEESVKKSTYWAVFEPNDANTWIKVKSMIENYLIQKWRDGALVGAKPGDAFFVKVGLGITMTAQDILEGRMNVEIGMAVVRPAEFIILKFYHKMQES